MTKPRFLLALTAAVIAWHAGATALGFDLDWRDAANRLLNASFVLAMWHVWGNDGGRRHG